MAVTALLVVTSPAAAGPVTESAGAHNRKPNPPTDLRSDGKTCATGTSRPYVLTATPYLSAIQSDPDEGQQSLTTWFHWWPSGGTRNHTDRVARSAANRSPVAATVPAGELSEGQTYVWQARTHDGAKYGAWSETCEFTVDATPPPPPGAVTSTDYPNDAGPRGGVGIAGVFEVAPPAERPHEVVEYGYSLDSGSVEMGTVPARASDDGASITVAPTHDGPNTLWVWSKDVAGHRSHSRSSYTFLVRSPAGPAGGWNFDEADGPATDGKWRFSMSTADTDTAESRHAYSDSAATADRWTHLAAVYEAATGTLRLYVNGVPQSTTATLPSAFNASGGLTVGRRMWDGAPDSFLDGAVDDVRIYNYLENPTRFAELAVPLPPVISFPDGDETTTGSTITVRFDAGGDTNVTRFRYDYHGISLGREVAATEPGGTAVVTIEAGDSSGPRSLHAASVDGGSLRSSMARASYTVVATWSLTGMVVDPMTWQPAAGAIVTLEPGGFQTTAGADGRYTFVGVPSGAYTVSSTHCGLSANDPIWISGQGDYWDIYLFPNDEPPGEGCPAER